MEVFRLCRCHLDGGCWGVMGSWSKPSQPGQPLPLLSGSTWRWSQRCWLDDNIVLVWMILFMVIPMIIVMKAFLTLMTFKWIDLVPTLWTRSSSKPTLKTGSPIPPGQRHRFDGDIIQSYLSNKMTIPPGQRYDFEEEDPKCRLTFIVVVKFSKVYDISTVFYPLSTAEA